MFEDDEKLGGLMGCQHWYQIWSDYDNNPKKSQLFHFGFSGDVLEKRAIPC